VLRRIFGPKWEGVVTGCRESRDVEPHHLQSEQNDVSVFKLKEVRGLTRMGDTRNGYRILVGKPERKRSLGKHRC
jgi:hypothetical protein